MLSLPSTIMPAAAPPGPPARAASGAGSAQTVMKARSLPPSAATRSRWARTTSTGETSFSAIIRARSAAGVQQSSAISEDPVLRGRLRLAEVHGVQARQQVEAPRDERAQRLQLRVVPLEAGEPGGLAH